MALVIKLLLPILALSLSIYIAYNREKFDPIVNYFKALFSYNKKPKTPNDNMLTTEQLQTFNGIKEPKLYLSILGVVYDVTKGVKHYGPGKQYNFFVGKDASRSFVTGQFSEDQDPMDDVSSFTGREYKLLMQWVSFYKKEYAKVGKLIGRYYDEDGEPTSHNIKIKHLIKLAEEAAKEEDLIKTKYPPCNVEWTAETGSRVWCTKKSGGVERAWIGVPRQYYEVGSKTYRCACINENEPEMETLKKYTDCPDDSHGCFIKE